MNRADAQDKIRGSFLLGGVGDALGAPIENLKLKTIRQKYGAYGLSELVDFKDAYGIEGNDYPVGQLTDDTTMTMTTAASMIVAKQNESYIQDNFIPLLNQYLWQGYLQWGVHQEDDAYIQKMISRNIDPSIQWPPATDQFWDGTGAGRGTIACLMQEEAGSITKPLLYKEHIRGKTVEGPNKGCGSMMRNGPLAFMNDKTPQQIFQISCETAALTHSAPDAFVATGITTLFVHFAAENKSMRQVMIDTLDIMKRYENNPYYKDGIRETVNTLDVASKSAYKNPVSLDENDSLPTKLKYPNAFLAQPVLAQVTYVLNSLDLPDTQDPAFIKTGLSLAVNHSGDSDSVAAIVGNVLGARYGTTNLPQDWANQLPQKQAILTMADNFHAAYFPPPQLGRYHL